MSSLPLIGNPPEGRPVLNSKEDWAAGPSQRNPPLNTPSNAKSSPVISDLSERACYSICMTQVIAQRSLKAACEECRKDMRLVSRIHLKESQSDDDLNSLVKIYYVALVLIVAVGAAWLPRFPF